MIPCLMSDGPQWFCLSALNGLLSALIKNVATAPAASTVRTGNTLMSFMHNGVAITFSIAYSGSEEERERVRELAQLTPSLLALAASQTQLLLPTSSPTLPLSVSRSSSLCVLQRFYLYCKFIKMQPREQGEVKESERGGGRGKGSFAERAKM